MFPENHWLFLSVRMGNTDSRVHFRIMERADGTARRFCIDHNMLSDCDFFGATVNRELNSRGKISCDFDDNDIIKKTPLPEEKEDRRVFKWLYYMDKKKIWTRVPRILGGIAYMVECAKAPGTLDRPIKLCVK